MTREGHARPMKRSEEQAFWAHEPLTESRATSVPSCTQSFDLSTQQSLLQLGMQAIPVFAIFPLQHFLSNQLDSLKQTDNASVNQLVAWNFAPEFGPLAC